ncbi:cob(I)yrinic acid a,c-diamide adenosyltransferase [Bacillus sp. SCS-153A]|uniref:cob(I)yrinic acid a,c-diamide adenosyltransferase n=1 Tax=Rossellomorea sedimentorum TaxID=3115294 RepID=UPI003905A066
MKIYSKKGDKGRTSIIGGRVDKDDLRVEAYGTIDELNSFVGKAVTELQDEKFEDVLADLEKIQHELFDCGGDLANATEKIPMKLKIESVAYLERRIDEYIAETPPLEKFILPGGTGPAATIHIARTITRRGERQIVSLVKTEASIPEVTLQYINRLSDYFFALARVINHRLGIQDVEYERSANVFSSNRNQVNKDKENQ